MMSNENIDNLVRKKPGYVFLGAMASFFGGGILALRGAWSGFLGVAFSFITMSVLWKEYKRLFNEAQTFTHKSFEGKTITLGDKEIATLEYKGEIPLITFTAASTPRERGIAMAQLTHRATLDLIDRYISWVPTFIKFLQQLPLYLFNPFKFLKALFSDPMKAVSNNMRENNFTFPPEVDEYLNGLVDGMNNIIRAKNRSLYFPHKLLTLEQFKEFICTYDTFKITACSTAARESKGKKGGAELVRNLEWPSAGVVAEYTLATITPVNQHNKKPVKKVLSFGIAPDLAGMSMANDQGLCVALNEAATTSTKRNLKNGIPQFLLIEKIAENCATIEDIQTYLAVIHPATTHSLTVIDKNGKGAVFEMLPPGSDKIYSIRKMNDKGFVHVTNHFFNEKGGTLNGSVAWHNSELRYKQMQDALERAPRASAQAVAKSAVDVDCIHQLRFYYIPGRRFELKAQWGNTTKSMTHQGKLDLQRLFSRPH